MTKVRKYISIFTVIMLFIIMVLLIILNISNKNRVSMLRTQNSKLESNISDNSFLYRFYKDVNYKLFFGEWEITDIIDENSEFGADENANELIGTILYFNYDNIKKNGETVALYPIYSYYVIPKTEIQFYPYMDTPTELGILGDFTLYIEAVSNDYVFDCNSFTVKDDNTLILYQNNAYYEMKRKSYIHDNIESEYSQV